MAEPMAKATVVREGFPNYQTLEGKENGRGLGKGYSRKRKYPYQALEGKEKGRDHGQGYRHRGKISYYQALQGKENGRA
jgi:hypothetical protein